MKKSLFEGMCQRPAFNSHVLKRRVSVGWIGMWNVCLVRLGIEL